MHEMAISESIIGILEAEAARQKYARVKKVWLEIGPLAGIETEALKFTFDVVTRGTLAEHAELEIVATEACGYCLMCAKNVVISQRFAPCPDCGGHQVQMTSGDEMRIKELEVE
ncbi:MAG: hydrogenase maturation nickel metallochaperone HypA [Hyphomicrobium sp.]|jgi:hydrogenase nickel incorporation protein HypA/HybF